MSLTCERSARYYENLLVGSHDSVDRVHAQGWLGDLLLGHQRSVKIFDFHLHVAKQRRHIVGPGATTRWGGASGPLLLSETRQVRGSVSAFEYGIRPMGSFKEDSEMMVLLGEKIRVGFRTHPFRTHTPNIPYAYLLHSAMSPVNVRSYRPPHDDVLREWFEESFFDRFSEDEDSETDPVLDVPSQEAISSNEIINLDTAVTQHEGSGNVSTIQAIPY